MAPQTTSSAAPESLAATLHNATIDKAERNDFSNTVTARCHSLQRTGTLALQRSLTLPRELVERILLLLDTKSTLKCRLVNREFNAIIQSSTLVQYYLACEAAGVVDNPQSPLSSGERLAALKKREDAWRKLKPVFETTIKPIDQSSMFHELAAAHYFLVDGKLMYCCDLPSSSQDNPQWRKISDHGLGQSWSGSIVEMCTAVYEHDLVVNVISSEVENPNMLGRWEHYSIDLVLLKFSTGEYHPLARHPLIHVQRSRSAQPFAAVRIVGDNLALVVDDEDASRLFIFDWKTGHKRLQHEPDDNAYENIVPVFVSPELLLVPNRFLSHFEIWHLFPLHPNPNSPVQILLLKIPAVSDNYTIVNIRCHGEPSPFLHSMPYFPPRPFFPSSENSIIIVSLILEPGGDVDRKSYQLIMHRRALLDMIQKWTSPSFLEQQGLLTWGTNQIDVDEVADPDVGSVRLGAHSYPTGVWTSPHPGSSLRTRRSLTLAPSQISPTSTSHISANSSPSTLSISYNFLQVEWANWGPPISRWFSVIEPYEIQTWFAHQSTGQKHVFLDCRNPGDKGKSKICVADFNLHNVKKNAEMKDNGGNGKNGEGEDEDELEILEHEGVFSEEVYMGLKCVVYRTPRRYYLDAVMMDEERLLGLKLDDDGYGGLMVQFIKVLYIG